MSNYDDIISLSRPKSNHPHLSMEKRAAQFSSFAALTGFDEKIKEVGRLTDKKIEMDDGLKEVLNDKLNYIKSNIKSNLNVNITYFVKDKFKSGGKYVNKIGIVKRIDTANSLIVFKDNTKVNIIDILNISI